MLSGNIFSSLDGSKGEKYGRMKKWENKSTASCGTSNSLMNGVPLFSQGYFHFRLFPLWFLENLRIFMKGIYSLWKLQTFH